MIRQRELRLELIVSDSLYAAGRAWVRGDVPKVGNAAEPSNSGGLFDMPPRNPAETPFRPTAPTVDVAAATAAADAALSADQTEDSSLPARKALLSEFVMRGKSARRKSSIEQRRHNAKVFEQGFRALQRHGLLSSDPHCGAKVKRQQTAV